MPFLVATAVALGLTGVQNFRAVSPSLPGLYRSAALESASVADAAHLLDGARIRTVLDLRNNDEIAKAAKEATPWGRALCDAYDRGAPVGAGQIASEGSGQLRRFHLPLLEDVDGFFDEVAKRMSPARKAEALMYKTFDAARYDQLLYDEVARGGQSLLYTAMLRTSGRWQRALELAADRSGGAVLIHCAQGKDRTGVLCALLQHAAGDDEASIVEAYAASEGLLDSAGKVPKPGGGVDWSALRGSPPEAMAETLGWLRKEYGAIDLFLESVGCGEAWRSLLLRHRSRLR